MLQSWLDLALPLRMTLLFVAGCCAGHAVNWAAMRWRIEPLAGHPWTRDGQAGHAIWRLLPVLGWMARRPSVVRPTPNTARPLLIEIATGLLWVLIYWWIVLERGTLPAVFGDAHLLQEPAARLAPQEPQFANWW